MVVTGAAFGALGTVSAAQALTLVAPNAQATVEGNTSDNFLSTDSPVRYQQVFGASQFSSLAGPQYINQISFRPDASVEPFTSNTPNIRISLSTTQSVPDGLSSIFSQNIGANNTLVYNGSTLVTSANAAPAGNPNTFDINFNLQTPFLYDPSQGNLLLDLINNGGTNNFTAFLDATSVPGDSTSIIFSNGTTATTGSAGTSGTVTQFITSATGATPLPTTPIPTTPLPTTPLPIDPGIPTPIPDAPSPPTEIPFEFSPSLGILLLGAWGAIAQLKSFVQKRKSSRYAIAKT